jgi:heme oxygenase
MLRDQCWCTAETRASDVAPKPAGAAVPAFVTRPSMDEQSSLSAQLRARTTLLHRQTDQLLGLPGVIRTRNDYGRWLSRFLGLYDPLERSMAGFVEWRTFESPPPLVSHSACIAHDLTSLGIDPAGVTRAPPALLPALPTFPHALGALYVLEGATLGGRFILRDVKARIGGQILGAMRFFGGRGEEVGPMWHSFRTALDGFGREQPLLQGNVLTGAEDVFGAILAWFAPLGIVAAELP